VKVKEAQVPFRILARLVELRRLQAGMQSAEQERRVKLAWERTRDSDQTVVLVSRLFQHFDLLLRPLHTLTTTGTDAESVETALVCLGTFCRTFSHLYVPLSKRTVATVVGHISTLAQHPGIRSSVCSSISVRPPVSLPVSPLVHLPIHSRTYLAQLSLTSCCMTV
jgi:hypothetical protein